MNPTPSIPNFDNKRALILHRPHQIAEALARQLRQLGMTSEAAWPDFPAHRDPGQFDFLVFDADMGHDSQFPWRPGGAPIPSIALIGSEAPGRLAWAIRQGADAHLLKPVGSGGVYSALVIAAEAFAKRVAMVGELDGLRARLDRRQVVAEATACLMVQLDVSADAAFDRLRRDAMSDRLTIEDEADRVVARLRSSHVRNRA
ncbi:MAG: ANTAR domain-containing response regulator [Devosia sp.]